MSEPQHNNDIIIYKEILSLRSAIDSLHRRLSDLEKSFYEVVKSQKPKKSDRVTLSPLQQKIIGYLKDGPKTQSEIVEDLDIPQPSVSHSLGKLEKELNIVESRPTTKPGARFEYIIKRELPKDILDLLSQL